MKLTDDTLDVLLALLLWTIDGMLVGLVFAVMLKTLDVLGGR